MRQVSSIRLLTWNIAHGRGRSVYQGLKSERKLRENLSRIAEFFVRNKVDIACLQEVDRESHWNKKLDLLSILKKEASYQYDLHAIHNERAGRKPLSYGNAVLSNFHVLNWEHKAFGKSTLGEKGFLYAEVTVGKWHLPIINLHLDYRSRKRRINQVEQVIAYLDEKERPSDVLNPIICGDFNTNSKRVGDAVEHLFNYLLTGHDYKLYPIKMRTFPTLLPSRSLDFVFLPAPLRRLHCEVCRVPLSDHCPVLLDISMPMFPKS